LPTPYQDFGNSRCVDVTAEYRLNQDLSLNVTNKCKLNGKMISVSGRAVPNNSQIIPGTNILSPGTLSVKFNNYFGWGDYNVIDIDSQYNYAIVGSNDKQS
jgi:apolipoprotein D and lipocalin family protein